MVSHLGKHYIMFVKIVRVLVIYQKRNQQISSQFCNFTAWLFEHLHKFIKLYNSIIQNVHENKYSAYNLREKINIDINRHDETQSNIYRKTKVFLSNAQKEYVTEKNYI